MTAICQEITGNRIDIGSIKETRPADLRAYISDCTSIGRYTGWHPKKDVKSIFSDIYSWIRDNEKQLKPILA